MFVEDLVKGVSVWEAPANDVDELPSQVSFTVLCKSNESVIQRNSRISGLFNEKC